MSQQQQHSTIKTNISTITLYDIQQIESIGKICLPIYYCSSDLLFLLFDSNYAMFKIINDTGDILGFIVAKKKFTDCTIFNQDDDDDEINFDVKKKVIRYHIMSIGVLPKYRKQGFGSKLIKYLQKHILKTHDYKVKMSLFVLTNNEPAIQLYEKNKFKQIFCNKNYYETLPVKSAYYYEFN